VFLPLPLLLGLLVVAAHRELLPPLPGSGDPALALPWLFALFVPTLLAAAAANGAARQILGGARAPVPPRALLRLSFVGVPLAVHAVYAFGGYGDVVDQWTQSSPLLSVVLGALPAFLAEWPRIPPAVRAASWCDLGDDARANDAAFVPLPSRADLRGLVRLRLGGPLFVLLPVLLLGVGMQVVASDRALHVFTLATTPGTIAGSLLLLLAVVALLPPWFRLAFAVQPLPEPPAATLRATAAALGFPPQRVLQLPTGMRALNAMLVGPLPFGRTLCLTDGIVRELDAESLAGVVAHEVGHARRGHPTLLMALVVVVPLLLMAPLRALAIDQHEVVAQTAVAAVGFVAAWLCVRALAHRFEHEADVASVAALGSGPCARALLVVSRLAQAAPHGFFGRLLSLHPDEPDRWRTMRRYEDDPDFRAAFDRQSRAVRGGIGVVTVVALAAAIWAGVAERPREEVVYRLHTGDHAAALRLAAGLPEPPAHWRELWPHVAEDLEVVRAVAPEATDWPTAKAALWPAAWTRGEDVLLAQGPAAARPWLAMALGAVDVATPLQRALLGWCEAAADGDPDRLAAIGDVIRRLGVPPRLARAFAQ
jgi:Zn-dependent protease with chaperone function